MKTISKKTTFLLALLGVTFFSVCTSNAESEPKFAPGIDGVSVSTQGTNSTVTVTIADDTKLSGDVILIAVAYNKTTKELTAVNTATYRKGVTAENSVSTAVSVSENDELKYFLLNSGWGTQKNYPPVAPEAFKASILPNSLELSWKRANDDFDSLSKYIIKADSTKVGEVSGDKTRYTVENLKADVSHDFEVIAVDHAGLESNSAELSQVFPVSNNPVSTNFDLSSTATEEGNVKFTNSELKIGTKSNAWTVVDNDMWWNTSSGEGNYEVKDFGENIFKLSRGNEKYFVVIFGENTKNNEIVNVTFDFWGSYRWQNGTVIYKNSSDEIEEKIESVDFNKWKNLSYSMKTDFDLTDYGYPNESGFVIVYRGSGEEYLWIKNLQVKNIGFAVGITADSTEASYTAEMLPCGNELSEVHGNAISGAVHRDGNYGIGYAYRQAEGLDVFYLTQMYDVNALNTVAVNKGYLCFKVDSNKFPHSPTAAQNLYLITEYYDGTAGDIVTKDFEISYTAKSWNWANSSATNIHMANDNTWKTHTMPLGDIYFGVTNAADRAAISYRIPNSNNGYNKCGILIRRVMIVDEGFYQKYFNQT